MGALRIGISGWTYPHWRGVFYPKGWPQRRELEFASGKLNSIEINGSFYALQRPSSYRNWHEQTPSGFLFAVKGSRFITHNKKLKDVERPLANFFASGVLRLAEKLGPILWQLSPHVAFDEARVASFLERLPRDTNEASGLAARHDERPSDRVWTRVEHDGPVRHAFEPRHPSFFVPEFVQLLRHHNAALVVADTAGTWPYAEDITADFVYIRLHGAEQLYASGYTDAQLDWWADRIRHWRAGGEPPDARRITAKAPPHASQRDIFIYFDNDAEAHAPFDALRLEERLRS